MKYQYIIVLTLIIISGALFYIIEPLKITDPLDPRFEPLDFDYCDYPSDEIWYIYSLMFKPGTEKKYIDSILVDTGGAIIGNVRLAKRNDSVIYKKVSYSQPNRYCSMHLKLPPHHIFIYDKNDRLLNIEWRGRKVLSRNSELE